MQDNEYENIIKTNSLYDDNIDEWNYFNNSYQGGKKYRNAGYLTKYSEEDTTDYDARIKSTKLDNHCNSIISVYNSFLFRENPIRELGSLEGLQETNEFLIDSDMDGRNINSFMKEVSTWTSVFGHSWIVMAKPNINAETRADEIALNIRPYVSLITPLNVLDWNWIRQTNGLYVLDYFKYIESSNKNIKVIKEWTPEFIKTSIIDTEDEKVSNQLIEDNQLGVIPAVISYAGRSGTKGIGVSEINDIADSQRYIYNLNSEIEQSVRIDIHKSLVKTTETKANAGAGSIINMPEQMDPGLKPYLLQSSGADVTAILSIISNTVDGIDSMSNTGAIRTNETSQLSGIAMETEFELLNARLAEKADNLELSEEQLWRLFALYQNKEYNAVIIYPDSFNIQDNERNMKLLTQAKENTSNETILNNIDNQIGEMIGISPEDMPMPINNGPSINTNNL